MYKSNFGTKNQVQFNNPHEFYELLGYLAKSNNTSSLVLETRKVYYLKERICFYNRTLTFRANLTLRKGWGRIKYRVNCNEFVDNLVDNHGFKFGFRQDIIKIINTIPQQYVFDFNLGFLLP